MGFGAYDVPVVVDETTGSAWGLNAGALYKGEKFSLGFNWRGGFDIDYAGDLTLDMSNVPSPPGPLPTNGTVATTFSFPHIFGIGAAFNVTEELTLTADVNYVLWNVFDEIVVETDVPGMPIALDFPPIEQNFENSLLFRVGGEFRPTENIAFRGGFLYDNTPQPVESMDPMLPDSNRWALTLGFGYDTGKFAIDLAYQYEPFQDRTSPNREIPAYQIGPINLGEGTYSTTAHLFGISFIFKF
jgi:long-chain fatty acid transport protein